MLIRVVVRNMTRWPGFLSSVSASSPRRSRQERCSFDSGGSTSGSRKVKSPNPSQSAALLKPERVEASAFNAPTSQQPAIQPMVPMARIGPNSRLGLCMAAMTMAVEMLMIGEAHRA
jgi:hypothetical protein